MRHTSLSISKPYFSYVERGLQMQLDNFGHKKTP